MPISARFTTTRYTIEDDGDGGSMREYSPCDEHGSPEFYYDELREFDTIPELAEAIRDHGCTTNVGASWCYSPDGSYTVDYCSGEQEEPAVFLDRGALKPRQCARLIALVSA